jgi:hypothetical protein
LTLEDRREVFNFLREVKVSTGFSANMRRLILMKDPSITCFKDHGCHVILTVLRPVAIRAIKSGFLKMAITRMCYFFTNLSQEMIDENEPRDLREFMAETQNHLEMCLTPAFFI